MAGPAPETSVYIKPYGTATYFNGCYPRKASSIVELPENTVQRFISVLGVEITPGSSDGSNWYNAMKPIGERVVAKMAEMKAAGELELHCRKGNPRNCGAEVTGIYGSGFLPDKNTAISMVPIHLDCATALIDTTDTNRASAAPEVVENAPATRHLDMGCHVQLGYVADLAGKLMLEELEALEAAVVSQ